MKKKDEYDLPIYRPHSFRSAEQCVRDYEQIAKNSEIFANGYEKDAEKTASKSLKAEWKKEAKKMRARAKQARKLAKQVWFC